MKFLNRFRKQESLVSDSGSEQGTRHCFVLCNVLEANDLSGASSIVSDVFGEEYLADTSTDNIVMITRGDESVGLLAHVPAAIPGDEAEEFADSNILWPNGREEAAAHRSHVIVTNVGGIGETPIESALTVSRLALVAMRLFDGIGVYWGNANVSNSRAAFEAYCSDMSEKHLPIPVWLRFQLVRTKEGGIGLYTIGMQQFKLMDIEVDQWNRDVGDLFEFVSNIAHYLVQSGPVIADGNTVGGSEEERIVVRHRPSTIDHKKLVYKIEFDV